ncbi:DUF4417 domain-containing protein [Dialister micraerophilus]|uniref:DUF4417 domain-containing protein n=1 Tax=Dialister micraerophilus TaxID=309120 RepID=UPI0023F1CD17|nr:DUF4417 domain-containing protein [Dialister micraerophilus]
MKMEIIKKKDRRTYLNLQYKRFRGVGKYDIPIIKKENIELPETWIGFNEVNTYKGKCTQTEVHFFLDDYQFERIWQRPTVYARKLSKFKVIASPDFSLYTDYPTAMQIWNTYRKQWIGAYLQHYGIHIIPTISWSDKQSFEYCFDGIQKRSAVIISDIGTTNNKEAEKIFLQGIKELEKKIQPTKILIYGNKMNIKTHIPTQYIKSRKERRNYE